VGTPGAYGLARYGDGGASPRQHRRSGPPPSRLPSRGNNILEDHNLIICFVKIFLGYYIPRIMPVARRYGVVSHTAPEIEPSANMEDFEVKPGEPDGDPCELRDSICYALDAVSIDSSDDELDLQSKLIRSELKKKGIPETIRCLCHPLYPGTCVFCLELA